MDKLNLEEKSKEELIKYIEYLWELFEEWEKKKKLLIEKIKYFSITNIMEITTTLIIVNIVVTAISGLIGPIAIGIGYFITHIKKSDCCWNHIELYKPNDEYKEIKDQE